METGTEVCENFNYDFTLHEVFTVATRPMGGKMLFVKVKMKSCLAFRE